MHGVCWVMVPQSTRSTPTHPLIRQNSPCFLPRLAGVAWGLLSASQRSHAAQPFTVVLLKTTFLVWARSPGVAWRLLLAHSGPVTPKFRCVFFQRTNPSY